MSTAVASLLATALASACGGGGSDDAPTQPPSPPGTPDVTFANDLLTVPLAAAPRLTQANGFQVFGAVGGQTANIVVLNLGTDGYRAFSSLCTHEGCPVASFDGTRIGCPCHGSQFDTSGRNVAGPARRPLAEYVTRLDAATRTLTVRKG